MPEFLAETCAPRPAPGPAAPGVAGIALAAGPASGPGAPARFPGAVPGDQTCLCPYQAPSGGAARGAMTRAGLRLGRISRAVTARPPRTRPGLAPGTQATAGPPAPSPGPRGTSARWPQLPAGARAAALFASDLPYRRHPGAAAVEAAISSALAARGGIDGCVSALAAAYGDHPDTAVPRMKWARQTIEAMLAREEASMLKCEVPVRMFSHRSRRAGSGGLGARSGYRTDLHLEAGMTRNAKLMTAAAAVIALMLHNTTTREVAQP